jgi:acyl-CoA thioester hydrolase
MITTEIRVAFGDTDPYGVIFFASYFRYFHRGIEDFFASRGLPPAEVFRNEELKFGLPIVQSSCRFLSPARYGDLLLLETRLKKLNRKALTFAFAIRREGEERLVAEGEAVMVGIDSRWKSRPLPDSIMERLKN